MPDNDLQPGDLGLGQFPVGTNDSPLVSQFVNDIQLKGEATPGGETSSAGATGIMQVLPSTATRPGFGVTPAADNSPSEIARVGRDYAAALFRHYNGNTTLASAAYNAGPGQVDKWLAEFGDPRSGAVTDSEWAGKVPFQETRNYIDRMGGTGGQMLAQRTADSAPITPPKGTSVNELAPGTGAGGSPQSPVGETDQASQMLKAFKTYSFINSILNAKGHSAQPVDYNPWALVPTARAGVGMHPVDYDPFAGTV
jgi:hypothetical protein